MFDSTTTLSPICESHDSSAPQFSRGIQESANRIVSKKPGRQRVAIKVYLEVEGSGSFKAGDYNTASGIGSIWTRPHAVLHLEANPAPGHRFSHWMVQNEFSGSNRHRRTVANRGMTIKAVFVPISAADIRNV